MVPPFIAAPPRLSTMPPQLRPESALERALDSVSPRNAASSLSRSSTSCGIVHRVRMTLSKQDLVDSNHHMCDRRRR